MVSSLQSSDSPLASKPQASGEEFTLIDKLLAEQSDLQTPVARFSEIHTKNRLREPDLTENFKTLIPLTKPGKDEQYAFQVELDKCTGCKACVSACHSLNGLDESESWRDVGAILGGKDAPDYQQTVTTACHHCESPECMHGCPVGAYDKDSETGIVRHLDDQCIGCSYCILKCPYDVPKYSKKRGIVRKCDMCHDRLAEGEAPACVQACPTEAIKIITVSTNSPPSPIFDPVSFQLTKPTTQFIGRDVPLSSRPADQDQLKPEHAHAPLIGMLTLTQIGAGLLLLPLFLPEKSFLASLIGTALVFAGLGIGALHLGQPLKVWRFFLGLKTSWLSREFATFGALTAFAPALVALTSPITPDFPWKSLLTLITASSTLIISVLAVATSVMLYADTRRQLWSVKRSSLRFYGTTFAATFLGIGIFTDSITPSLISIGIISLKVVSELRFLRHAKEEKWSADQHSARLQIGPLKTLTQARTATALVAILTSLLSPLIGLIVLTLSELIERTLFFTSVRAPKMPGQAAH